ncbi:MAG: ATP-dependent helicase, partial [Gemmatimonadetes bacterium]|nr:ATP-dependent helicase [Gemmatimonadota bacterium]
MLQEGGAPRDEIARELARFCRTAGIAPAELEEIVAYMLEEGILFEDGGILGLGEEGRALYGARNHLELFSVFLSPPLFTVFHGSAELGHVHELTFQGRAEGPVHLALGRRTWRVRHVDWSVRRAYVEPGDLPGRSRWLGSGQPMRFALARTVQHVLLDGVEERFLSRRAAEKLGELREEHAWLSPTGTTLRVSEPEGESRWWTFAGDRYTAAAAAEL